MIGLLHFQRKHKQREHLSSQCDLRPPGRRWARYWDTFMSGQVDFALQRLPGAFVGVPTRDSDSWHSGLKPPKAPAFDGVTSPPSLTIRFHPKQLVLAFKE
jgi:hypothetical protein